MGTEQSSATDHAKRAEDTADSSARQAASHPTVERIARAGIGSRGLVYLLIALLATLIAAGRDGNTQADRRGAVQAVAAQPFGRVALLVLCLGFLGHILWQGLRAATRHDEGGRGKDAGRRAAAIGIGVTYVLLLISTISVLAGSSSGDRQQEQQQDWTARLLGAPGGRVLVALVGLIVVGVGIGFLVAAAKQRFARNLDLSSVSETTRRSALTLGSVGQASRGVVFVLVGGFLLRAAQSDDAAQSRGLDATLRTLAAQAYGPVLLGLVALGLAAYGAFSFVEMRYRADVTA